MTLILSTEHNGYFLTISDLAITGAAANSPVAGRPLDPAPTNPQLGSGVLVALQQKAIRFDDRRLLLWAGDIIVARRAWTALHDAIRHGWSYDLAELVGTLDLSPEQKAGTHFIFHDVTAERLIRQVQMCKEAPVEGQTVWFMGSGDWHFIDYTVPTFSNPEDVEALNFLRPWLTRLGSVFFDEAIDQSNFQFQYGGWFEMVLFNQGKLKKVPYLIKLWRADGEVVISLPTFACWYIHDHLCIMRTDTKHGCEPQIHYTIIPDSLARTPLPTRETAMANFSPAEFQIHIIFDHSGIFSILPTAGKWSQFNFGLSGGRVQFNCGPELKRTLLDRFYGSYGRITRPA